MSVRVQWIEHQGKKILYCNYTGIRDEDEYVQAIADTETEVLKQAPGTVILMLIDATGSRITSKMTERARALATAARKKGIPSSPTAVVGVTGGAQHAILLAMQFMRPDLRTAASIAEAKEWLVGRAGK